MHPCEGEMVCKLTNSMVRSHMRLLACVRAQERGTQAVRLLDEMIAVASAAASC